MQLAALISWWYGDGFIRMLRTVQARFASLYDYFSIDLLLKTLFLPFRQISAGRVTGSIDAQLRAFLDQMISRIIGTIVRSLVLIIGCVAIVVLGSLSLLYIILWAAMPVLPIVGLVLMLVGWVPWNLRI